MPVIRAGWQGGDVLLLAVGGDYDPLLKIRALESQCCSSVCISGKGSVA